MDDFLRFAILLTKVAGHETTEALIRQHVQYLRDLDRSQHLVLCGPFVDYEGGMVIVRADSLEEAQKMASSDPFVKSGVRTCEVRTWKLSCEENNHLGMG